MPKLIFEKITNTCTYDLVYATNTKAADKEQVLLFHIDADQTFAAVKSTLCHAADPTACSLLIDSIFEILLISAIVTCRPQEVCAFEMSALELLGKSALMAKYMKRSAGN